MNDISYQAIVAEEVNGTFSQSVKECFIKDLPHNDVLIRVHYSSLNYKDALSATGHRGVTKRYPFTPGIDAAGVIIKSKSPIFNTDDKVIVTSYDLGMNTPGGFGEYISVPAEWIVPLPPTLTLKESMMIGTSGLTAGIGVHKIITHPFLSNDLHVLVTGATGAVGSFGVTLLSHLKINVTAATGKVDQEDFLKSIGANKVVHRDNILQVSDRALLSGKWNASLDTVGGSMLDAVLRQTEHNGIVACCGNVLGNDIHTSILPFILRGITLAGIDSGIALMGLRKTIWEKLSSDWKLPNLQKLSREISLMDLPGEFQKILEGKQVGKVLVKLF